MTEPLRAPRRRLGGRRRRPAPTVGGETGGRTAAAPGPAGARDGAVAARRPSSPAGPRPGRRGQPPPQLGPELGPELWREVARRLDCPAATLRLAQADVALRRATADVVAARAEVLLQRAIRRRRGLGDGAALGEFFGAHASGVSFRRAAAGLVYLDLADQSLTAPRLAGLALDLERLCPRVRHLELADNALSDGAVPALSRLGRLTSLGLAGNAARGIDCEEWHAILPALASLDLGDNPLMGWRVAGLASWTRLKSLRLANCDVGWHELLALGPLCRLRHINLDHNRLEDRDADPVTQLCRLSRLSVCDNRLRAGFVRRLTALTALRHLAIGDNPLGAEGGPALASLGGLVALEARAAELAGPILPLAGLSRLVAVDLGDNRLCAAHLDGLTRMQGLVDLGLADTAATGAAWRTIAGLTALTRLEVAGSRLAGVDLAGISALTDLADLDLSRCGLTANQLPALRPLAGLTHLDLGGARLGPRAAGQFRTYRRLTALGLAGSRFTDAGLWALVPLTGLRQLDLRALGLSGRAVAPLAAMPHLARVQLGGSPQLFRALGGGQWWQNTTELSWSPPGPTA